MKKNLLDYIKNNINDLKYEMASEPYYDGNNLLEKKLSVKEVIKFTNFIQKSSIKTEKIGIFMENCLGFVNAFYAIILNNKIVVSINNNIDSKELDDIIKKNKLDTIITNNDNLNKIKNTNITKIINVDDDYSMESSELLFNPQNQDMDDVLVISYTSGTSGSYSKGVELTYNNITFVSEEYQKVYHLDDKTKIITVLPLWHNYAMFACLTSSIVAKSKLIIMKKWDANLFIDINKEIKPEVFPGSPYMYIDLINNYNNDLIKLNNLKVCDSGGDSLPIECIKKFEKETNAIITEGYGLTETASLTHFNYSASLRKIGSLGKTVSNTECKILDLNGNEVSTGDWGLLWIKGPMVFKDYVELPGQKAKVKNGDWFNTNDVVRCDNEGYYYLAGRFSDLNSLNNDDNQLRELENELYKFNGISRVHLKTNYNSIANFYYFDIFAILKKSYEIQDLYDYINANLKKYVIGEIKIVETLPTTGTGKVKRNKIDNLLNINLNDYKQTELSGGLRCKTVLLEGEEKFIYQEYRENTMYQAKKKYDITNMILKNRETNFIPKAFCYGIDENKTWLITEYKEGKMLNDLRNNTTFSFNSITKDLAETLYLIHTTKCDKKYGWITDKEVFEHYTFVDYLNSEIERFKSAVENNIPKDMLNIMLEKATDAIVNLKKYDYKFQPQLIWFDLNPNNILIKNKNNNYQLSAIIDAGGAKYGIKEWDLAFLRMETCVNEEEYQSLLEEYKKLDNTIDEQIIKNLCIFIELDDMIIRILDKQNLPIPYDSEFKSIIESLNEI